MEFFERFVSFMNIHFPGIVHVNVQRTFTSKKVKSKKVQKVQKYKIKKTKGINYIKI